ncbi:hypothetical protein SLEP1_g34668 [Rubroshorea leprosula]|uniref:SBP-type domain-containing protein n=1 Tax=Rubroshorea leprosula TaxID=152421 RepID=A0AAV5KKS9_9ROSI|nr:hypothetical protein SLEP1_g34668 [Rubroshorea leprosula]
MESWSYVSGEKGFLSDSRLSPSDSFARSKSAMMNWELKGPYSFGNNLFISGQQATENHSFGVLSYGEPVGKQLTNDSVGEVLSSRVSGGSAVNPIMGTLNYLSGEDESSSKLSSSVVDSYRRDSSLIDLKLGRFADHRDDQNFNFPKGGPILSSSESSTPHKRVRATGLNSHTAYCQVYGCNKDLSSLKDYYKRHKVCEIHSKTAKVIVNGMEQRFCQQCSRFHLLAEFDDGKRSCRKRLAGHNERRRKPQVGFHSGRTGRLLQSYNDSKFHGTMLTTTSFICQDLLPNGLLHPDKYVMNDWCKRIKAEEGTGYGPLPAIPMANGHFHSKSLFPPSDFVKPFPPFHDNVGLTSNGIILTENSGRYSHEFGDPNSVSQAPFQYTALESEDFNVFNTASNIQGLSGISDSGCALSLLSSQSQNSSSHSSGIPLARPLVVPTSHTHYSMSQVSEKLIGVTSQASTSALSNKISSSGMNSTEKSHSGPILISNDSEAANFDIAVGIYQGSEFVNAKNPLSCEEGPTIDLLQLSSQLQQVHQRQSLEGSRKMMLSSAFGSHKSSAY